MESEQQISLPSLLLIVVLGGLVIRYLFFSPAAANTSTTPRDAAAAARQRETLVERLQQMFPQVDRRTILWDLQRNGNSIAATSDRILAGRMETVSFATMVFSRPCIDRGVGLTWGIAPNPGDVLLFGSELHVLIFCGIL